MTADDDRADVDRVLAGDVSAFEGIVRRWQRPLVNLAYRFCFDRSRAEDMTQDAFLRAFRALAGWRRDAAFSTWLFRLATNLYCSELRRIPARMISFEEIPEPTHSQTAHHNLESGQRERAVRRAVLGLPPKYREPLILFYFHEKDIAAAAESLGLAPGTVKARLFRGREILRRKLAGQFGAIGLEDTQ